MKRTVIANWKMSLTLPETVALAQHIAKTAEDMGQLQIILAPSLPWLMVINETLHTRPENLALSSQVVSAWPEGAYTGDVSAKQLRGLVDYSLVGHSERRKHHHETGDILAHQIKQLLEHKITPVVCFGEMSQAKQATFSTQITSDLKQDLTGLTPQEIGKCLFAYEPIWAIGTGNAATPEYVAKAVEHVKSWFNETFGIKVPILYGGSVNETNASDYGCIRDLDGLLVGGASLQSKRFAEICEGFSGI